MQFFPTWLCILFTLVDANVARSRFVANSRYKSFSDAFAHALSTIEMLKEIYELK